MPGRRSVVPAPCRSAARARRGPQPAPARDRRDRRGSTSRLRRRPDVGRSRRRASGGRRDPDGCPQPDARRPDVGRGPPDLGCLRPARRSRGARPRREHAAHAPGGRGPRRRDRSNRRGDPETGRVRAGRRRRRPDRIGAITRRRDRGPGHAPRMDDGVRARGAPRRRGPRASRANPRGTARVRRRGLLVLGGRPRTGVDVVLRRSDPERHPHRDDLHAAGAAAPRLRDEPGRRTEPLASQAGTPILLPHHRSVQRDVQGVYAAIGYRRVCESTEYRFRDA
jgi:hypothetical protein